jgi:hypothetical protein
MQAEQTVGDIVRHVPVPFKSVPTGYTVLITGSLFTECVWDDRKTASLCDFTQLS